MARSAAQQRYLAYRVRYLPQQMEATRTKLRHLENEAHRLGLTDLLETAKDAN